ncbi:MAG: cation:proton antiporter [Bacteriovoracaceae bacterium]|nr:cation:proton antiporter [Bacteriovoracaceae bacterium]
MNVISKDLEYIFIFLTVLILPKILLRFKIPTGITALFIGVIFSFFDPNLQSSELIRFLSQIGITSLFLFAGFEVDLKELKSERSYLTKYLAKFTVALVFMAGAIIFIAGPDIKSGVLLTLGLMTPSAGFIISSLSGKNLPEDQEYWIKSKAISKEILAIVYFFLVLQIGESNNLILSLVFVGFMIFIFPKIFLLFFKFISPLAPHSEIPFLIAIALASGVVAKEIGLYYLIGAFIIGLTASMLKDEIIPKEQEEEAFFNGLSQFFVLFLPFYFFQTGLSIDLSLFTLKSFFIAIVFFALITPVRIFLIKEELKQRSKEKNFLKNISVSLLPTLIFGLVISKILTERSVLDPAYIGGLVIYTILSSLVPVFMNNSLIKKENPNAVD